MSAAPLGSPAARMAEGWAYVYWSNGDNGDWVRFDDYLAALREIERLKAENAGMLNVGGYEHMRQCVADAERSAMTRLRAAEMIGAERDTLRTEVEALLDFIARRGYRRCDIPACNCNSFHGGLAETRLSEIHDELGELAQGETLLNAVATLRAETAHVVEALRAWADEAKHGCARGTSGRAE